MAQQNIGGQALIEGVMIRSPKKVSVAVRAPSGEILTKNTNWIPWAKRKKVFDQFLIRGVLTFVEMLVIGIKSLNYSADIAAKAEDSKPKKSNKAVQAFYMFISFLTAFGISLVVFLYIPIGFATLLGLKSHPFWFNLTAGILRVSIFLLYIYLLSKWKEFKRIFEYHGAEHKSIYAYENGEELTYTNIQKYPTMHPRCGTSFLFMVVIFAIIIYSFSDSIYLLIKGIAPTILGRFFYHLLLLPIVAGLSYEFLKLSSKKSKSAIFKVLSAPGLWLQKITTQEPDEKQIEVAVVALQNAVSE